MVNGVQLDYELKPGCSSRFNQKMFGRISTRKTRNGTYAYYIPGVLDNIPHYRIYEGRIFIGTSTNVDFDPVMPYCNKFEVSTTQKSTDDVFLKTGKEKWQFHAQERGFKIDWY